MYVDTLQSASVYSGAVQSLCQAGQERKREVRRSAHPTYPSQSLPSAIILMLLSCLAGLSRIRASSAKAFSLDGVERASFLALQRGGLLTVCNSRENKMTKRVTKRDVQARQSVYDSSYASPSRETPFSRTCAHLLSVSCDAMKLE
jgi:hypothetical protein